MPESGRRRWRHAWIAGAVLFTLAMALTARLRPQRFTLPDGATITLKAVAFGTNHHAPPRLLTRCREQLPPGWLSRLGLAPATRFDSLQPRICFWFSVRPAPADLDSGRLRLAGNLSLLDEHGIEQRNLAWLGCTADGPRESLEALSPDVFPRRQPRLHLRLRWPGAPADLRSTELPSAPVDFVVRNPLRSDWAEWTPTRLPVTAQSGDAEFTLAGLEVKVVPSTSSAPSSIARDTQATARFAVTSGGGRSSEWTVDSIQLQDATGNSVRLASPRTGREEVREAPDAPQIVDFHWPLWLDEPAYRMRVEFVRKPDAVFPPGEVLEVRGVPVPPANGLSLLHARTNLQGLEVNLMALVGEQATLPGREHDVFGQTTLEVDVPPLPDDLRFDVVRVVDDRGQPARQVMASGNQSFGFQIAPDARTVDIRVAVSRRRIVEYLVKPQLQHAR
jgi:hypothetical protein